GNIELIKTIAEILLDEPNKFKQILKKNLSKGLPFPKAQACALAGYISQYPNLGIDKEVITEFLKSPNNILGIEYLKALLSLESSIKPVTIKRFQSDYHSNEIINGITSARSIRKVILGSDKSDTLDNIRKNVPTKTLEILIREFSKGMGPISKDDYSQILLYNLSHLSENDLLEIFDVNEGLENRILQKSKKSGTFTELIKSLKTKRYTTTRLQRILTNMLININKTDIISFYKMGPQYLRVLGFTEKGQEIIRKLNNFSPVPVITKTAHYKKYNNRYLERMIEYDILATDIYSIAYQNPNMRQKGWDFFNNPIRI
ncbi:MAG: nucleotidyltransferase family protein, partial [Clostridium sp.]|nr:nucleotidyltransferase family protein [Clostridium sp.]